MDWLRDEQIRESFNRRAAVLDEAVACAHAKLALETVRIIDWSNRTGLGKGMPDFSYRVLLEDRRDGEPVSVARVTPSFVEPPVTDVPPAAIEASWLAEEFWPGSNTSLLKVTGGCKWEGPALPTVDEVADVLVSMMHDRRLAIAQPPAPPPKITTLP